MSIEQWVANLALMVKPGLPAALIDDLLQAMIDVPRLAFARVILTVHSGRSSNLASAALRELERLRDEAPRGLLTLVCEHDRKQFPKALAVVLGLRWRELRHRALEFLRETCLMEELPSVLTLCLDEGPEIEDLAREVLRRHSPDLYGVVIEADLESSNVTRTAAGLRALEAPEASPAKFTALLENLARAETDANLRSRARRILLRCAPDVCRDIIGDLLQDPWSEVAKAALVVLPTMLSEKEAADALIRALGSTSGELAGLFLEATRDRHFGRLTEALAVASRSPNRDVREAALRVLKHKSFPEDLPVLRSLSRDREGDLRCVARQILGQYAPAEVRTLWLADLRDRRASMRAAALDALRGDPDPLLVDVLIPLARDENEDVRSRALGNLTLYDDPRAFSELVSSLNDVAPKVRAVAAGSLKNLEQPVPVLARFPTRPGEEPIWNRMQSAIRSVQRWAREVGVELLGCRVRMHPYRQGLGRTYPRKHHGVIIIDVSDTPVTSNHPHGVEIMKGLVLHELGHHICDLGVPGFTAMCGIARSEGVRDIFDVLLDERLERNLRARRAEWGRYFDRLASY